MNVEFAYEDTHPWNPDFTDLDAWVERLRPPSGRTSDQVGLSKCRPGYRVELGRFKPAEYLRKLQIKGTFDLFEQDPFVRVGEPHTTVVDLNDAINFGVHPIASLVRMNSQTRKVIYGQSKQMDRMVR